MSTAELADKAGHSIVHVVISNPAEARKVRQIFLFNDRKANEMLHHGKAKAPYQS